MSEWISVKDRLPDVTRRYLIHARGDVTEAIFHTGSNSWEACNSRQFVTAEHWQPLPSPPPKPDAFEEFWNSPATDKVTCLACFKDNARLVFEAGAASEREKGKQ